MPEDLHNTLPVVGTAEPGNRSLLDRGWMVHALGEVVGVAGNWVLDRINGRELPVPDLPATPEEPNK